MRYSPTKYEFRLNLTKKKQDIFYEILGYFDVPNTGLLFIFDLENYDSAKYPSWGIDAQALDLTQSDVDSMCPEYIWRLTRQENYQFLLWFSKNVSLSRNINFAWVLSHELTHYKQSTITPELLVINSFLHEILPKLDIKEVKSLISIPIELDAELNAWKIITNIFTVKQIEEFFDDKISDHKYANHYKSLRKFSPNSDFSVLKATADFLGRYYDMILNIQKNSEDQYLSTFDINSKIEHLKNAPNKPM